MANPEAVKEFLASWFEELGEQWVENDLLLLESAKTRPALEAALRVIDPYRRMNNEYFTSMCDYVGPVQMKEDGLEPDYINAVVMVQEFMRREHKVYLGPRR